MKIEMTLARLEARLDLVEESIYKEEYK
jgi:hypothetical protein